MNFKGQVAIVTGAGTGLGRAYALWLAERGAAVIVNNRQRSGHPPSAKIVAAEITARGGKAIADEHAVESPDSGKAMVKAALEAFGRIDIVICNAGVHKLAAFHELDLEEFRRVVDINLWGTIYPIHAAWPFMIKQGYGRVVLTTSTGGLYGFAQSTPYSTSKASLIGLARGLALDVPEGADIKVNVIAPSANTRMLEGLVPVAVADALQTEKVVPAVGWLASKACNQSGMVLSAGGGRVLRVRIAESAVVDIPDEEFNVDWGALNSPANLTEPSGVPESLAKLLPKHLTATIG